MASDNDIAIVGMAVRLPGAHSPEEYWHNLRNGVESVRFYTDDELLAAGVKRDALLRPNYVKAGAPLDGMENFDAEFLRLLAEGSGDHGPPSTASSSRRRGRRSRTRVTCPSASTVRSASSPGSGMAAYFAQNLITNPELVRSVGMFLLRHTGNDKDFLSTRVSYLLDLRGPAINVQTACSTSLVARRTSPCSTCCRGECDMALAGRRDDRDPAPSWLPLRRRRDPVARRSLPRVRPPCRGHRVRQRHRRDRAAPVAGRDRRRRSESMRSSRAPRSTTTGRRRSATWHRRSTARRPASPKRSLWPTSTPSRSPTSSATAPGTAMGDPIEVAALTQAFRGGHRQGRLLRPRQREDQHRSPSTRPQVWPAW